MESSPELAPDEGLLRVAAVGDIHARPAIQHAVASLLARMADGADVVLLAGDLTTHGDPEQASVLAGACQRLEVPVVAVLGNHDLHSGREQDVLDALRSAGVLVLEREHVRLEVGGIELGIVGLKGFVGGFGECQLPDFGEPLLRSVYAETSADVAGLESGLGKVVDCQVRIALMHYSPTASTLAGEPQGISAFLGSERLAAPLIEHRPQLIVHGHAHRGQLEGELAPGLPVYNVSAPLLPQGFRVFELPLVTHADVVR
jgi:Icc-related predicted phosphoesterase